MADLKIIGQTTSKSRAGNAGTVGVTGTRDGAIYVADYILAMAMEGRLFHAGTGSASSPSTFTATASYDATQPELVVDVPSGTTIIPVRMMVYFETSAGTLNEWWAVTSTGVVGAGTSTAVTPLSTRTSRDVASTCSCYTLYSASGTAPAGTIELYRAGYPFADATGNPEKRWEWSLQTGTPQVIVGPGALAVYALGAGTAPTGYLKASWIELPSTGI